MPVGGVRKEIVFWLGREFVFLSCDGAGAGTATEQMEDIFVRVRAELHQEGLALDQVLRTRLWAKDRQCRDLGSNVRVKYNVGQARAATSSYIMPAHLAAGALVGLDVIALKPGDPSRLKTLVESRPLRTPVSHLIFDSLLVLSGKTVVLPTLTEQLEEILPRITRILRSAGSGWERVVNLSCYLHHSQTSFSLRNIFSQLVPVSLARMEIIAVDGYSAEEKLIEVEVTAETAR